MSKFTKQIMESFKGMVPEDKTQLVESAVNEMVSQVTEKVKAEYEAQLEESYKEWDQQVKMVKTEAKTSLTEAEAVAYEGYEEAKTLLQEKEQEIANLKAEFDTFLKEQYKDAKEMLDVETGKNEEIEQRLYESYSKQIEDIKEDLVNKIDSFIGDKVEVIAESVRKELKNSPEVLESKVAFDQIKNIVSSTLTAQDFSEKAGDKVEALEEQVQRMESELKALKAKNLRLATENHDYEKSSKLVNESSENERRDAERRIAERMKENVEGHGKIVMEDLITETVDKSKAPKDEPISEVSNQDWRHLAGLNKQ
jgi:hypothetical protein